MPEDQAVTGASSGSAGSATSPSSEDDRIKGLQRAVSEKAREAEEARRVTADLQRQIEELRVAGMSEADRTSYLSQRERERLNELAKENERLKLAQKYPKVAETYSALLNARSAEEQAIILQRLLDPQSAAPEPPAEPSDVDLNNPMRSADDPVGQPPSELQMDEATARRILQQASVGNRPYRS